MAKAKYFVGLKKPDVLRRHVLQAAKVSFEGLKLKYDLAEVQEQRMTILRELTKIVKGLEEDIDQLEGSLPDHDGEKVPKRLDRIRKEQEKRAKQIEKAQVKRGEKVVHKKKDIAPVKDDDGYIPVEEIERKLAAIERKLSQL